METEPLTFAQLEARCKEYILDEEDSTNPAERWALGATLLGGAVMLGHSLGAYIALAGLVIEVIGFLFWCYFAIRSQWKDVRQQHKLTAERIDRHFDQYQTLVRWLRQHPHQEMSQHLRFIRDRKAAFLYRHGLLIGGLERFGVLPVLIVLYLQFKDWQLGDWRALAQVHFVGGVLLLFIFITYVIGWIAIRDKSRFDFYESVLAEACVQDVDLATGESGLEVL
ncbi:hypothetical protein [Dyella psychrodurans]|uniref:DUF2270 domain-containing protein n=1 Tax=Dyella psychrodurans TaxID=1927960 RepID=A0A370WVF5_9GAMM|nr:hypothetical protein [Dyella psychrodurans]RDS79997.1 hypothetical protein DWU99_20275 [Dyella psychrodurans]